MLTRVMVEFENIDMAEIAAKRVKESVKSARKTGFIYNKKAEKTAFYDKNRHYTILPLAATTFNYITASIEYEMTEDTVEEPKRNRRTMLYIICEDDDCENVKSILSAMGGLNISYSSTQSK